MTTVAVMHLTQTLLRITLLLLSQRGSVKPTYEDRWAQLQWEQLEETVADTRHEMAMQQSENLQICQTVREMMKRYPSLDNLKWCKSAQTCDTRLEKSDETIAHATIDHYRVFLVGDHSKLAI